MKRQYKCDTREPNLTCFANKPIISVIGGGKDTYLWIGNDEDESKFCFATLSGRATLRTLANSILAAIKPRKKKRRTKP